MDGEENIQAETASKPAKKSNRVGLKIWYVIAIILCALVILTSAVGVVGTWVLEQALADVSVTVLGVVSNTAGEVRSLALRIDTAGGEVRQISSGVSLVSNRISKSVEDQGVIKLLLPTDQEERIANRIDTAGATIGNIRDKLAGAMTLYQSINRMPFVSLPMPKQETIDKIQTTIENATSAVQDLRQGVQDFRSGTAGQIDRVTTVADRVTAAMDELSSTIAQLDSNLAALQEKSDRLQNTVPTVFAIGAFIITLFLAYVIYTEVEVIMIYLRRWKRL